MTIKETKEMIALLEAYIKGEEIELSDIDDNIWIDMTIPEWNFENYKYRIKPKENNIKAKFRQYDKIIHKEFCDGRPLGKDNDFLIIEYVDLSENKYEVFNKRIDAFEFFNIEEIDENYINTDDCLWYWEYRDVLRDSWHTHGVRLNKAAYKNLCTDGDWDLGSEPIYQLGARLPEEHE